MINIRFIFILIIFIFGLYFTIATTNYNESFENKYRCPNMLIEKDGKIILYNSKLAQVPGVNPIQLNDLEEYIEFMKWQKSNKINCPLLHLKYTTDSQNNEKLQIKPDFLNTYSDLPNERSKTLDINVIDIGDSELLDANNDKKSQYNKNLYQGYDRDNQYIGLDTPLDKKFNSSDKNTPNPMDTNWGGIEYTQRLVDSGKYKDRYVIKN